MRLIDADALKSELIAFYADSAELFNEVSCLVDSAKTAEKIPELADAQTAGIFPATQPPRGLRSTTTPAESPGPPPQNPPRVRQRRIS